MSLNVTTKFDYNNIDFNKENDVHLQVKLTGNELPKTQKRNPLNLIVAIDVSGSMYGNKLIYAKDTLIKLIENLTDQDRLGVVAYSDNVWTLCNPSIMTNDNKTSFKTQIGILQSKSLTNLSGALLKSEDDMFKNLDQSFDINRVIFLTDGLPTSGETNFQQLVNMVNKIVNQNNKISYSFFGYGSDVDGELLTSMAKQGKGNYYFISSLDKIKEVFAKELGGLISIVAQNIQINLKSTKDVQIKEVLNDLDVETKDDLTSIDFDDIYAEEERTLIIKMLLPQKSKAVAARASTIADIEVKWFDNITKTKQEHIGKIKINYVSKAKADTQQDKEVEKNITLLEIAKAQLEARKQADQGQYDNAQFILRQANLNLTGTQAYIDGDEDMNVAHFQVQGYEEKCALGIYSACDSLDMSATSQDMLKTRSATSKLFSNKYQKQMVKNFGQEPEPEPKPEPKPITNSTSYSKTRTIR